MLTATLRRTRLLVLALGGVAAVALAGCGTTEIDAKKAESLIRKDLATGVTAKSVHCPSGVKAKAGTTITCTVSLVRQSDQSVHNGTVTVHITSNSGHAQINGSDFHVQ